MTRLPGRSEIVEQGQTEGKQIHGKITEQGQRATDKGNKSLSQDRGGLLGGGSKSMAKF